jgi:hypothetical protein
MFYRNNRPPVAPSKQKKRIEPYRIRGALTLVKSSVPKIALKHDCNVKTLYAVLDGARPGNDPKIRKAIAEMEEIARGVLSA